MQNTMKTTLKLQNLPVVKNLVLYSALVLKSMRPKQWVKNGFLFVALFFDGQMFQLNALFHTFLGGLVFCMLAGVVYLINDMMDIEADKQHPTKKFRPLASGALPVLVARFFTLLFLALSLYASFALSPLFFVLGISYLLLNLGYSTKLKHVPVIELLVLAAFYVLRVAAGVSLIEVERFSPWLYLFTTFIALFLGTGKRRAEMARINGGKPSSRRVLKGYTLAYLDQILLIVVGMVITTYSIYTFSAANLAAENIMMLTIPFIMFSMFRYLYLIQVEGRGEAPEDVLYTDRPLQATIAMWGIAVFVMFYVI